MINSILEQDNKVIKVKDLVDCLPAKAEVLIKDIYGNRLYLGRAKDITLDKLNELNRFPDVLRIDTTYVKGTNREVITITLTEG